MDKNWKLQRYDRKDYSELVEFPVEIVGRDGVVRRYTFEDSIRLYQRRITFAPIRYRDNDLVRAEVNHCGSRIGQLRRSYFHRFGWGTPVGEQGAELVFGALAGELAAFLRRVLRCDGRPEVHFQRVHGASPASCSTWFVRPLTEKTGMILYVQEFNGDAADETRNAFFSFLKDLERMRGNEGDGERLIAFHHASDCGFVLTGRGTEYASLIPVGDDDDAIEISMTPWDEALEVVRRGEYSTALQRAREMIEQQPYHRNAYLLGSMLANFLGEHVQAEEFALLGSRYFPADGTLLYYLGLSRSNQDRPAEAEANLNDAVAASPGLVAARSLLAGELVRRARFARALDVLVDRHGTPPDDRRGEVELKRLEALLRTRRLLFPLGLMLLIGGLLAAPFISILALLPVFCGCGVLLGGRVAMKKQLEALAGGERYDEISQGLRRLHRTSTEGIPVS
jgi:hypothetical protein